MLVHVASRLDALLAPRIYDLCYASESGRITAKGMGVTPLHNLNSLRQFICGGIVLALFDLPWLPLYFVVMLLFHPALAVVALVCMGIMFLLALGNQRATTAGLEDANERAQKIASDTAHNLRNAEAATAMGMVSALTNRWRTQQNDMLSVQTHASNAAGGYSAVIKAMNIAMQSAAITTGAILAMQQAISPGVMIGAALLLGRSLAPIQQAVMGWKGLIDARQQYHRLNDLLLTFPPEEKKMELPPIMGALSASGVVVVPPTAKQPTLLDINFSIPAGTTMMVLGPSAAGKSTLVRTILGLWPTADGAMRIDHAEAVKYNRDEIGPQIGYLPQSIELLNGTVAQNIARFGDINTDLVVQAAEDSGIHEMILSLPDGYDTKISDGQALLSPGQRQRVALARAIYNRPRLVVLDEPNSNLDDAGEKALNGAIATLKSVGSTVVLVSHRQGAMPLADYLLVMAAGKVHDQGPPAEVVARARELLARQQNGLAQQANQTATAEAL